MKRKLFAAFLAAALMSLALAACGGGGGYDGGVSSSGSTATEAPSANSGGGSWNYGFSEVETDQQEEGADTSGEDNRLDNAKIIYTANVEAETTAFEDCAAGLEALVEQMKGYMEFASTEAYNSGYRSGRYTIRVPAANFEPFLKSVGQIGHIVYQDKSGDNISEQYYDIESRLATQRTKLERLQALLAQAENMEDIITIESAISETELAVEQLTGSLRHYDALVDYATIYVTLSEVLRLSDVETAPPGFGSRLESAFTGGLVSFGDFLQGVAIFLAYNWIWLLILAVIAVSLFRILRRREKREHEFIRPPKRPEAKKPDDKQPKD